jgi:hypothetical protein
MAEELTDVQHRKRMALLALRDVEYDFHAGKLDEVDYRALKAQVSAEALAALDDEAREAAGSVVGGGGRVGRRGGRDRGASGFHSPGCDLHPVRASRTPGGAGTAGSAGPRSRRRAGRRLRTLRHR